MRSCTRAGASRHMSRASFSSTRPAPAATVSRACACGVSPSATAAAMPPCAQALDAPSPIGAAVRIVTGRGASLSPQNRPAMPPPMITTSCGLSAIAFDSALAPSALEIDHPLDRAASLVGDRRIDHDLLLQVDEAVED